MIKSAAEFVSLRTSESKHDYMRAVNEPADTSTWLDVVRHFPEMRFWVAQNKTVPLDVLELLAEDGDPSVRGMVAMKNKLSDGLFQLLAKDKDPSVRQRVACNKKAPREILEILAADEDVLVSEPAMRRLGDSEPA